MTQPDQPTPPPCPACTVQPYEPDLGPHHAHLTDYGYVLYGATPPQLDFVQSLLAEGRRLATEQLVNLADQLDADCAEHGVASAVSPGLRNAADVLTGESWLLKQAKPTCICPMFDVTAISDEPSVRKVVQGYDHACPACPPPSWATAEQDGDGRG